MANLLTAEQRVVAKLGRDEIRMVVTVVGHADKGVQLSHDVHPSGNARGIFVLPSDQPQVEVQISHEQGVEKDGDKDVAPLVETFLHPVQFPQGLVGVVALVEQFVVNFPQASGLERLA